VGGAGEYETGKYGEGILKPRRYDPERDECADTVREMSLHRDSAPDPGEQLANYDFGLWTRQGWCLRRNRRGRLSMGPISILGLRGFGVIGKGEVGGAISRTAERPWSC
jgi:hypothetical protein